MSTQVFTKVSGDQQQEVRYPDLRVGDVVLNPQGKKVKLALLPGLLGDLNSGVRFRFADGSRSGWFCKFIMGNFSWSNPVTGEGPFGPLKNRGVNSESHTSFGGEAVEYCEFVPEAGP